MQEGRGPDYVQERTGRYRRSFSHSLILNFGISQLFLDFDVSRLLLGARELSTTDLPC